MFVMGSLYGSGNPWHTFEDVTHTFESYAISGLDGDTTQARLGSGRPQRGTCARLVRFHRPGQRRGGEGAKPQLLSEGRAMAPR